MLSWNRVGLWAALVAYAVVSIPAVASGTDYLPTGERQATITLGRNPEPPVCASPEDIVDIWWTITYSTTPMHVYYQLRDPNGNTVEDSTYIGATGTDIARQWSVPLFPIVGKYWIRVEYWSMQANHEATAEVSFYVCAGTGRICATKWKDADCNGTAGIPGDFKLSGWWLCISTPWGDTFCDTTGLDGRVCWERLPLGAYTVYDPPVAGWIPLRPPSYPVDLVADSTWSGAFFNVNYDECYGACCKCDGACVEVTRTMCDQIGFEFMGLGTHCKDIQCGAPSTTEKSTWSKIKENFRK